jgi:hypothetical protein
VSSEELDLLLRHGHTVILVVVFLQHIGLPIPGVPVLLTAGALAGTGQLDFATTLAGLGWLGWRLSPRSQGRRVLRPVMAAGSEPS